MIMACSWNSTVEKVTLRSLLDRSSVELWLWLLLMVDGWIAMVVVWIVKRNSRDTPIFQIRRRKKCGAFLQIHVEIGTSLEL
jgi:hypothetical protein